MAGRSHIYSIVLVVLLVLVAFSSVIEGNNRLHPGDCQPRCNYRCSATSHRKPCMFFCLKCCSKCLCVPKGTYGNKQSCPCYNNWKTQQGGPKCP
ncbi:protein RSI-1-like [Chenopodium quinoa]|uniref:protein RSI-1-like n=1 Tax=Chenopodium quinoa TaxID=63459 RepID=UPI000B78D9A0|nr:protein RSI-1-like [Chenopodium quinoa]